MRQYVPKETPTSINDDRRNAEDCKPAGCSLREYAWVSNMLLQVKSIYTLGRYNLSIPQGECDLQIDWHYQRNIFESHSPSTQHFG